MNAKRWMVRNPHSQGLAVVNERPKGSGREGCRAKDERWARHLRSMTTPHPSQARAKVPVSNMSRRLLFNPSALSKSILSVDADHYASVLVFLPPFLRTTTPTITHLRCPIKFVSIRNCNRPVPIEISFLRTRSTFIFFYITGYLY